MFSFPLDFLITRVCSENYLLNTHRNPTKSLTASVNMSGACPGKSAISDRLEQHSMQVNLLNVKYLLLAECEVRTASYGASFSFLLWTKREARGP